MRAKWLSHEIDLVIDLLIGFGLIMFNIEILNEWIIKCFSVKIQNPAVFSFASKMEEAATHWGWIQIEDNCEKTASQTQWSLHVTQFSSAKRLYIHTGIVSWGFRNSLVYWEKKEDVMELHSNYLFCICSFNQCSRLYL